MAMSRLPNDIFPEFLNREKLIVAPYRDLGVICFDGTDLGLFHVDLTSTTQLSRLLSTIKILPPLPKSIEIKKIAPNSNGSKIALIGQKTVFVASIHEDFWAHCSVTVSSDTTRLQSEYLSEVELVHPNISLGKNPLTVRCCRWYRPAQVVNVGQASRKNYLGILYSDNVFRLYNLSANYDFPITSIDYQPLLFQLDDNPRFKTAKGVGYNSQMTSFDFGPIFSHEDGSIGSILATDREGDLYFSFFNYDGSKSFTPTPLRYKTKSRINFFSDVCDLILIPQSASTTIPVFALATADGIISHVILVQIADLDIMLEHGENIFDVFIYDSLDLSPSLYHRNVEFYVDPVIPTQYIVLNASNVYSVDISSWLTTLHRLITSSDNVSCAVTPSSPSMVRHLFMSMGSLSDKNKENAPEIVDGDAAFIRCVASFEACSASLESGLTKSVVFLAITNSGHQLLNTVKYRLFPSALPLEFGTKKLSTTIKESTLYDDILSMMPAKESFPTVSLEKLENETNYRAATNLAKSLISKLESKNMVFTEAENRARQLASQFTAISANRVKVYNRLQNLLGAYAKLKDNLAERRDHFKRIEARMDLIYKKSITTTAPLTEAQKSILHRLEDISQKLNRMTKDNVQNNIVVLEERRQVMGSTKAFQASGRAQKFMLGKNQQEIARLSQSISKLESILSDL